METVVMVLSGLIWLVVILCLLLSAFRPTREIAAAGLNISSYILGIWLWLLSCLIALSLASFFWMVVGILFMGVGVFFVALVATALAGNWTVFGLLLLQLVIVKGMRMFSYFLIEHSGPKDDTRPLPPLPPLFN